MNWHDDGHELVVDISPLGVRPVVICPFVTSPSRNERPCHRLFELYEGVCGVGQAIADYVHYCDHVTLAADEEFNLASILWLDDPDRTVRTPTLVEWMVSHGAWPILRPSPQAPDAPETVHQVFAGIDGHGMVIGPITAIGPDGTTSGPGVRRG